MSVLSGFPHIRADRRHLHFWLSGKLSKPDNKTRQLKKMLASFGGEVWAKQNLKICYLRRRGQFARRWFGAESLRVNALMDSFTGHIITTSPDQTGNCASVTSNGAKFIRCRRLAIHTRTRPEDSAPNAKPTNALVTRCSATLQSLKN